MNWKEHRLPRDFYLRDTVTVARDLLGKILVHQTGQGLLAAEITETEAYTGVTDRACHGYGGRRTARTEMLYRAGGHAYVYLIYGMYDMFNVVTEPTDSPCAVLIRAGRPVEGWDAIAGLRFGMPYGDLTPARRRSLLDGPGKLCRGLALTRAHSGQDLLGEDLFLADPAAPIDFQVGVGKRINIDYAEEDADLPYRFFQIGPKQ